MKSLHLSLPFQDEINNQGFLGALCQKSMKTKSIFLNINHNITHPRDEVAASKFLLLFFDMSCRINVNLIFLLIILLET